MSDRRRIAVIGGGAAGLGAAIAAGEVLASRNADDSIRIYEASDKIGRSILASGNGRCNFSNAHIDCGLYRNSEFAIEVLGRFEGALECEKDAPSSPNAVVDWFVRHGLAYREEGEGRLYPVANKSSSVLEVLTFALGRADADVLLGAKVASIEPAPSPDKPHVLRMSDGSFERAEKVVLACGGEVAAGLLDGRLSFNETRPVLCPLKVDSKGRRMTKRLENIRVKCEVSLLRSGKIEAIERGEAMFRKYGVSGICAFNLSRFARPGDTLRIDLLPDMDEGETRDFLERRASSLAATYGSTPCIEDLLRGILLPRLAEELISYAGLSSEDSCTEHSSERLTKALHELDFSIEGPADVEHAQISRGGFQVEDFHTDTLESKSLPGIYVVGEALDVDGPCGGYNLHWAFATGIMAGRDAAAKVAR